MAYGGGDECQRFLPRINYFSNPDIDYLGLPIGNAESNNARCIKDNMVRLFTL